MSGITLFLTLSCIITETICICYLTRDVISLRGWKRILFYSSLLFFESSEIVSKWSHVDFRYLQIISIFCISVIVFIMSEKKKIWQIVCLWNNVFILRILCQLLKFIFLLISSRIDTSLARAQLSHVSGKMLIFCLFCYVPTLGVTEYLWKQLMLCSDKVKKHAGAALFCAFILTFLLDEWQQMLINIPCFLLLFTFVSFGRMLENKMQRNKLEYYKMMEAQIAQTDQEIEAIKQQVEVYYNHVQGGEQYKAYGKKNAGNRLWNVEKRQKKAWYWKPYHSPDRGKA